MDDTYENENMNPQPEEQLPVQPEVESDGFYHGAGAGVTEETVAPEQQQYAAQSIPQEPQTETAPLKEKGEKKILRKVAAVAAALALVVAGSGISIGVMNIYWQKHNENLVRNFEQRLEVLQKELDRYQDEKYIYVTTAEGLTPTEIYQKNIASVVAINCSNPTGNGGSAGSGFVFTKDGYIVTNHHVVSGYTEGNATISVVFDNGTSLKAKFIGSDSTNDIALLKVEATDLQPVTIGSSDALQVGDQVVAIGNALGELSFSLTVGYVSGMDRDITTEGTVMNMIQTDVAINSGNSGGPLFNAKGEVVGITSAKYSGTTSSGASIEGISFAIPMDDVLSMLENLRDVGYIKSAYLGITCRTAETLYGMQLGVQVVTVADGGSAEAAGILPNDIITNLGGYTISNMSDLTRALRQFEPGEESTVVVWRNGKTIALSIVFQQKPQG